MDYIEMLSRLGAGSAHPGGFIATLEQLAQHPLPVSGHILEVGCGTGRTACHLAERGYRVTAVDIHKHMLTKARSRARKLAVDVDFIQADVCSLPLTDDIFDAIIAESVTNFTPVERSLREYCRVLKPGGTLYDREMIALHPLPAPRMEQFTSFFGIERFLTMEEWLDIGHSSGFSQIDFVEVKPFDENTWDQQGQLPDPLQQMDESIWSDSGVWQSVIRHTEIISDNISYLAYGLIRAQK